MITKNTITFFKNSLLGFLFSEDLMPRKNVFRFIFGAKLHKSKKTWMISIIRWKSVHSATNGFFYDCQF